MAPVHRDRHLNAERPPRRIGSPANRLTAADVMSVAEVAELLHVPRSTISDWARRGIMPSVKIGRRRLYVRHQIEARLLQAEAR